MPAWIFLLGPSALLLCFFCDHTFASNLLKVNVRWVQILCVVALASGTGAFMLRKTEPIIGNLSLRRLTMAWSAFFFLYLVSALLSTQMVLTGIKLGWAISSILGSFCLVFYLSQLFSLERALTVALLGQAFILTLDWLSIYWFRQSAPLIGSAQISYYSVEGFQILRPSAFYYEPSYYASMMGLGLLFVARFRRTTDWWVADLTFVIGGLSLVLSSSRLASIGLLLLWTVSLVDAASRKDLRRTAFLATSTLLCALCCLTLFDGRRFMTFFFSTNGAPAVAETIENYVTADPASRYYQTGVLTSSGGTRLRGFKEGIEAWLKSPIAGSGVPPKNSGRHQPPTNQTTNGKTTGQSSFPSPSMNTWIEILEESGVLGLLGFLTALIFTLIPTWKKKDVCLLGFFIFWLIFVYNLNPIFPRVDLWFLVFCMMTLVLKPKPQRVTA